MTSLCHITFKVVKWKEEIMWAEEIDDSVSAVLGTQA